MERRFTPVHCVSLRFTAFHSISLRFTPFHSVSLRFTPFYSGPLRSTLVHSGSLRSTPVHSGSLWFTLVHSAAPTAHFSPRDHMSIWTLPGSCYLASILDGPCLMYPPAPPSSPRVIYPYLLHAARLAPMDCPNQPLIHAPINAPLFLHPRRSTTNSARQWDHTICDVLGHCVLNSANSRL